MKGKNCIILDDSDADANYLKQQLGLLPFFDVIKTSSSIEETLGILADEKIDLLFLDIKLKNQSGLHLLKSRFELPPVIITSAYSEYAVESYEIGKTADFLVKPFSYDRLLIAINRALSIKINAGSISGVNFIFLKMGRKINRFDFTSIDYIEAYGIYSKVVSNGQIQTVNERIANLALLLPSNLFKRVHKSYLINITKITSFDRNYLWIGQLKIPIGISFRPKLEGLLRLFDRTEEIE